MLLDRVLQVENVRLHLLADSKEDVLRQMSCLLYESGRIKDRDLFLRDVLEREKLGFTGAGNGIAIPHGVSEQADQIAVAVARCEKTIRWDTWQEDIPDDARNVRLVILFAVPDTPAENADIKYIEVLKTICGRIADKQAAKGLMEAEDPVQIMKLLKGGGYG